MSSSISDSSTESPRCEPASAAAAGIKRPRDPTPPSSPAAGAGAARASASSRAAASITSSASAANFLYPTFTTVTQRVAEAFANAKKTWSRLCLHVAARPMNAAVYVRFVRQAGAAEGGDTDWGAYAFPSLAALLAAPAPAGTVSNVWRAQLAPAGKQLFGRQQIPAGAPHEDKFWWCPCDASGSVTGTETVQEQWKLAGGGDYFLGWLVFKEGRVDTAKRVGTACLDQFLALLLMLGFLRGMWGVRVDVNLNVNELDNQSLWGVPSAGGCGVAMVAALRAAAARGECPVVRSPVPRALPPSDARRLTDAMLALCENPVVRANVGAPLLHHLSTGEPLRFCLAARDKAPSAAVLARLKAGPSYTEAYSGVTIYFRNPAGSLAGREAALLCVVRPGAGPWQQRVELPEGYHVVESVSGISSLREFNVEPFVVAATQGVFVGSPVAGIQRVDFDVKALNFWLTGMLGAPYSTHTCFPLSWWLLAFGCVLANPMLDKDKRWRFGPLGSVYTQASADSANGA